ncbi:MAG: hypothetical protein HYU66_13230 [Armatimonadetes bacterium]|nr:hypothetical protein [Armatimonadota bacterium]
MSLSDLVGEIEKLTPVERRAIRAVLDAMDHPDETQLDASAILARRGIVRQGTGKLGHVTPAVVETDTPVSEILIAERR